MSAQDSAAHSSVSAEPAPKCKRCKGARVVDDGEINHYSDGTPYLNGPVKCVKDCPACNGTGIDPAAVSTDPVATLRFQRGTPGHENDMPEVVSCNWLPDGVYSVYLAPPAPAAAIRRTHDRTGAPLPTGKRRSEAGAGDDVPCAKCGAALDTGLECTECGHDMAPELARPAPAAAAPSHCSVDYSPACSNYPQCTCGKPAPAAPSSVTDAQIEDEAQRHGANADEHPSLMAGLKRAAIESGK